MFASTNVKKTAEAIDETKFLEIDRSNDQTGQLARTCFHDFTHHKLMTRVTLFWVSDWSYFKLLTTKRLLNDRSEK